MEELKEKAFKKLKEELRDNVEAREFLQRLRSQNISLWKTRILRGKWEN